MKNKNLKKSFLKSMEEHFAIAGLAEACPSTAREYMHSNKLIADGSEAGALNRIARCFSNTFTAAGLTDGDVEMARNFIREAEGIDPTSLFARMNRHIQKFLASFESTYTAVALAEGSLDMARDYLEVKPGDFRIFSEFLEDVGLKRTQIQYGIAFV